MGVNTGFRVSELLSLTLNDVLERTGEIKKHITVYRRNMKGGHDSRTVRLNPQGAKAIRPWLEILRGMGIWHKEEPLFLSSRLDKAIDRNQAWKILAKAYKTAGLTGRLGTHCMRKTFANMFYNHQLDLVAKGYGVDAYRNTSKALGHRSLNSTDKYLSFKNEEIEAGILAIGI